MKMRDTMFNYLVCNEHGRIPEMGAVHLGCAGGVRPKLDFLWLGFRSHPPGAWFFSSVLSVG
jgi:hypothetical protein